MRIAIEKEGPGIAFWRAKKHGWDKWAWGFLCFEIPEDADWWHWNIQPTILDFDFAKHGHFDELALIRLNIGPLHFKALYIEDRQN